MIKYMQVWDDWNNCLGGIQDLETGGFIPMVEYNRDYQEYLRWVDKGNIPAPPRPSVDHEWKEDKWVLNEKAKAERELAEARMRLRATPEFVALVLDVINQLKNQNLIEPTLMDDETKATLVDLEAKWVDARTKRENLKEIPVDPGNGKGGDREPGIS